MISLISRDDSGYVGMTIMNFMFFLFVLVVAIVYGPSLLGVIEDSLILLYIVVCIGYIIYQLLSSFFYSIINHFVLDDAVCGVSASLINFVLVVLLELLLFKVF